jgi:hypothetical protein
VRWPTVADGRAWALTSPTADSWSEGTRSRQCCPQRRCNGPRNPDRHRRHPTARQQDLRSLRGPATSVPLAPVGPGAGLALAGTRGGHAPPPAGTPPPPPLTASPGPLAA